MVSDLEQTVRKMERVGMLQREEKMWGNSGLVWLPRGMKLKENVYSLFVDRLEEAGYEPFQLPRIVPAETLETVKEEFMDFTDSVFWLTHQPDEELENYGAYLNSTSDPVLNHFLSLATRRNPNLLPFKGFLREQLFRPHTGSTKPFINGDENTDIIEAYSIQLSEEECFEDFEEAVEMMREFFDDLGLSYYTIDQPIRGNKPVARQVTSVQSFLPQLGCATRMGTVYMHDDTFSQMFNVYDEDEDGNRRYGHQVGFGFGERFLLALLGHHGDEHGFRLMPNVAPSQIAIIPFEESEEPRARKLAERLGEYRTEVDTTYKHSFQKRLGDHLELGTPVRVTLSEGDRKVEFSRRDTLERAKVTLAGFIDSVGAIMDDMDSGYRESSRQYLDSRLVVAESLNEVSRALAEKNLVVMDYCDTAGCGEELEDKFPGEVLGSIREMEPVSQCVVCGDDALSRTLYGRRSPTP